MSCALSLEVLLGTTTGSLDACTGSSSSATTCVALAGEDDTTGASSALAPAPISSSQPRAVIGPITWTCSSRIRKPVQENDEDKEVEVSSLFRSGCGHDVPMSRLLHYQGDIGVIDREEHTAVHHQESLKTEVQGFLQADAHDVDHAHWGYAISLYACLRPGYPT